VFHRDGHVQYLVRPGRHNDVFRVPREEVRLAERIIELATQYGRYGYRRITAMLRQEGWQVNHKRVERIWRKRVKSAKEAAEEKKTLA